MDKQYILVKLLGYGKVYVILKNIYNDIIFEGFTDNFGVIYLPVKYNNIYKLIVKTKEANLIIPLYAKKNEKYCIPVNISKKKNNREVTIYLKDYNYPDINISEGEVRLWDEDILSI